MKKVPSLDVQTSSGPFTQGLMLVCTQEKIKDLRVRKAIAHAINTPGIVEKILLGGGSNVLVSDRGVRGVVIMNRARLVKFESQAEPPRPHMGASQIGHAFDR